MAGVGRMARGRTEVRTAAIATALVSVRPPHASDALVEVVRLW